MKEQYSWNYNIKIKTKQGLYEYEDKLENIEKLIEEHRNEEDLEISATKEEQCKKKVLKKQLR